MKHILELINFNISFRYLKADPEARAWVRAVLLADVRQKEKRITYLLVNQNMFINRLIARSQRKHITSNLLADTAFHINGSLYRSVYRSVFILEI